ncbi:penicillin acylase family protein [Streptomyces sp. NPDC046862]|uniref:penicillin acylase family protein n=1 Tax=Streptomyces sp. NPDC046862 TaxID=3154603 RepID=UPI0034533A8A
MPEAELFRDALGIPHLRADDELDLAFAQGRVTAIDRAWQIEVERWRAECALAAHIGVAGLEWDRFAARSRLPDTARRAYASLGQDDRAWVDAYVAGVNVGLEQGRSLNPEFEALDALPGRGPERNPWPNWAPIGVFLVAHVLYATFPNVLWRAHVAATLGETALAHFDTHAGAEGGSNAWALHGDRTASGAPLLAGDPHRLLELPGVYQQVRLACDAYDVVGFTFPGVPGVQHYGHTGRAAWGITNAMAHSQQVFRERLRGDGGDVEALGPQGWEPADAATVEIRVRGADPVHVRSIETRRGTVVVDDAAGFLSLRQPMRVTGDVGISAFRRLMHAQTARDIAAAFEGWVDPVNRVLAADRSGTVLRLTAGIVPVVPFEQRWLPLDAAAADPAPFGSLPAPEVVARYVADANERPTGRPGHDVGDSYASSARAERITELLEPLKAATVDDLSALHADTLSFPALALVARLRRARCRAPLSPAASRLADLLEAWDGRMASESEAAGAFAKWRWALTLRLTRHPGLAPLSEPHGMGPIFDPWLLVPMRIANALASLLDAQELGIDGDAELLAALESVADEPAEAWGERHRLHPLHILADVTPGQAPSVPAITLDGDADTVLATVSVPGLTDRVHTASVTRWIWDLADRESSRWNVPFGSSGVPGSPHFADQLGDWQAARTSRIVTDWARLRRVPWP